MEAKSAMRCLLAVLWLSGSIACGGDDETAPLAPRGGKGGGGRGGSDSKRDAGPDASNAADGSTGDGGTTPSANANAPRVELLSPEPAADPNDDTVITTETLTARCRVTKSMTAAGRDVNFGSVRISLINPEDEQHPIAGVVTAQQDGEFEAEFRLTDLVNGKWMVRCEADDMGKPPLTGRDTNETFIDLGPTVEIIDPVNASAHRLLGNVGIKFRVSEQELSSDDDEATPTAITLQVSGVDFGVAESPDEAGLYTASVNFDERSLFPMPPTTASIVVTAKSSRTPDAPTRTAKVDITIDSVGPTITVKSPGDGMIVRSEVNLQIQVTDESGVNFDTVVGTISLPGDDYILSDWTVTGTTFAETFDTRSFDPTLTQLTINIVAEDRVGNLSPPATHLLRLDNVAPLISLDPPKIREYIVKNGMLECSEPFDPVGDDATNDLDTVPHHSLYRVVVDERTNHARGETLGYIAGVNDKTMRVFAQPDPAIPLLVDTNGDDLCDEISYDELPLPMRPTTFDLSPMTRRGSATYSTTPNFADPENIAAGACVAPTAPTNPNPLCNTTPMTRVIGQQVESGNPPPAIYAFMPTNSPNNGACNGNSYELLPIVDEGWACIAARVEDLIGNVGISTPLRVCFDDGAGTPACNAADPLDVPPTCTDGCTLPDAFPPNLTVLAR